MSVIVITTVFKYFNSCCALLRVSQLVEHCMSVITCSDYLNFCSVYCEFLNFDYTRADNF